MTPPTEKLSKSDGATGVRELRASGWSAADVRHEATRLAGHGLARLMVRP
jgi:glutamyl/glutaminyl-tRNA synthetase